MPQRILAVPAFSGVAAYEAAAARHREIVHDLFFEHVTTDEAATMRTALERVLSRLDATDGRS